MSSTRRTRRAPRGCHAVACLDVLEPRVLMAATLYEARVLGEYNGDVALNNQGQAVWSHYYFDSVTVNDLLTAIALPAGATLNLVDLNDYGVIVGNTSHAGGFVLEPGKSPVFLRDLPAFAGTTPTVTAINNNGAIAGTLTSLAQAFVWTGAQRIDIPNWAELQIPRAINSAGQVAVEYGNLEHKSLPAASYGAVYDGTLAQIPFSGQLTPRAIGETGVVVGEASFDAGDRAAFAYIPGHGVYRLPMPRGYSFAADINDAGHIVGSFGGRAEGEREAFIYADGQLTDLDLMVLYGHYREALAINNAGQIVAVDDHRWGVDPMVGGPSLVLLTPVVDSTPPTASLLRYSDIRESGGTSASFSIGCTDNLALDYGSTAGIEVVVTGPRGFVAQATKLTGPGDTTKYTFTAPGGRWDATDAGAYTISIVNTALSDRAGNHVVPGAIGNILFSPEIWFNEREYLAMNADVAGAVVAGVFASGYEHFVLHGRREGRRPMALFNAAYYLEHHADVAAAVAAGVFPDALEHFIRFGIREGRSGSRYFDEGQYLGWDSNRDVKAVVASGRFSSGLEHFLALGQFEGRDAGHFDARYYVQHNADLWPAMQALYGISPVGHWIIFGQREGRYMSVWPE